MQDKDLKVTVLSNRRSDCCALFILYNIASSFRIVLQVFYKGIPYIFGVSISVFGITVRTSSFNYLRIEYKEGAPNLVNLTTDILNFIEKEPNNLPKYLQDEIELNIKLSCISIYSNIKNLTAYTNGVNKFLEATDTFSTENINSVHNVLRETVNNITF